MTKQVSIKMLEQEVQMYDEFVEIPVTIQGNSEEYTIKLYPFFKPEKIRDLVNDLIEFFKAAEVEKLTIPQIEEDDLIGFFMVKYFTNLKFTNSKKAKVIYKEFKTAINTSVFKVLIQSFPKESIAQVMERIYEVRDYNAQFQNIITKAQNKIKELPLENRELLFKDETNNVSNVLADK